MSIAKQICGFKLLQMTVIYFYKVCIRNS